MSLLTKDSTAEERNNKIKTKIKTKTKNRNIIPCLGFRRIIRNTKYEIRKAGRTVMILLFLLGVIVLIGSVLEFFSNLRKDTLDLGSFLVIIYVLLSMAVHL